MARRLGSGTDAAPPKRSESVTRSSLLHSPQSPELLRIAGRGNAVGALWQHAAVSVSEEKLPAQQPSAPVPLVVPAGVA